MRGQRELGFIFITFFLGLFGWTNQPWLTSQSAVTVANILPTASLLQAVELSSEQRNQLEHQLKEVINTYLAGRNDLRSYDFWIGDLNSGWVEMSFWYLSQNGTPVGMEPVSLFAQMQGAYDWKIFAPWLPGFNTALENLPDGLVNKEILLQMKVPDKSAAYQGTTLQAISTGGFLFAW